jgi:hypothetical protein
MKNLKIIKALLIVVGAFAVPSVASASSLLEIYQQA